MAKTHLHAYNVPPLKLASPQQIAKAWKEGQKAAETEPRAKLAWYDPKHDSVIILLRNGNGRGVVLERRYLQDLQDARLKDLRDISIIGRGGILIFNRLNVTFSIPRLVAGYYGSDKWMLRILGQVGGRVRSAAKAAAARTNGKKGGRPRKASEPAAVAGKKSRS